VSDADEVARRLLRSVEADQSQAGIEQLGALAGALFVSLDTHVPSNLAATLTRDWFFLNLCRSLWPDHMPQAPFWDTLPPEPPRGDE
jgi:hypothetical protein